MDNQPVFEYPILGFGSVVCKGSPGYSAWHNRWCSSQGPLRLECPACRGRLIQSHYCGLIYENVHRGGPKDRSQIKKTNCHIHDKHQMHSKKRKAHGEVSTGLASTSTVVSMGDSLAVHGDGDDDDAVSVQSDS